MQSIFVYLKTRSHKPHACIQQYSGGICDRVSDVNTWAIPGVHLLCTSEDTSEQCSVCVQFVQFVLIPLFVVC